MSKLHIRLMPPAFMVLFLIIIGTLFYSTFEGWGIIDSMYFTVMTLTTVGYGDIYPTTHLSKLFTMVYVLVGVGFVLYTIRIITAYYIEKKTPVIKRAMTQTLQNMVHRKKSKGEVIIKVEAEPKKP